MADVTFFSPDSNRKIANTVRAVERMANAGQELISQGQEQNHDIIYARITAKDPEDKTGYFQLEEVGFNGETWEAIANGKQFDGTEYDYAHHYNWEDAEVNTVVKLKLVVNIDTGAEDWVFFHEVTNPAAFVFIADETGNTARSSDSQWSIIRGGSVLTNVGVLKLPGDLTMKSQGYAGVLITFIEDDGTMILASAIYTNSEGKYWTASEGEGTIIINFPLATSSKIGDKTELTQLHVGDIHLEISAPEEEEIRILGDETWIQVTKVGNTWTVSHILPGTASLKKDGFTVLDEAFPCDQVAFSTLQDAEDWANSLLDAIQRISYDIRGHIYEQLECDGTVINSYDDVDDLNLTSTLTANSLSSQLVPNIIDTDSGIDYSYTIKNGAANFLDFIAGGDFNTIAGKNSLGEVISLSKGDTGGAPNLIGVKANGPSIIESVKNVGGTSGGTYGAGTELVKLDPLRFRFNDTLEVIGNVAGKAGIRKSVVIATEVCTWSVAVGDTVIRHNTDPNASEFLFTAQASIANLDRAYQARLRIAANDGTLLEFSVNGQGGPYNVTTLLMPLDAASNADTPGLYFKFPGASLVGDVFKMTIELITDDANVYDANVVSETFLSLSVEDECIIDENGNELTNEGLDCLTSIPILETIPSSACASPGTGLITGTNLAGANASTANENDEAAIRILLQDSASIFPAGSAEVNLDKGYGAGKFTLMRRSAQKYDLSGITGSPNLNFNSSTTSGPDLEIVAFYKVAASLPAVNNPLFDLFTWTPIGKFSPAGANVSLNLSGLVPEVVNVFIGFATKHDFDNNFAGLTDVVMNNSNTPQTMYNCS